MHRPLIALFVLTAASAAPVVAAPILLVDDFSATAETWPLTSTSVNPDPILLNDVQDDAPTSPAPLGGVRVVAQRADVLDIPGLDAVSSRVFPAPSPGVLDYTSSSGASGKLLLAYGLEPFGATPLGLSLPPDASLQLTLLSYDAPTNLPLSIRAGVANADNTLSGNTPDLLFAGPGGPQTLSIPLSSIDPAVLAHTDSLSLLIAAPAGADFRIDSITLLVPEPATLSLLALCPSAVLLRRRRRHTVPRPTW